MTKAYLISWPGVHTMQSICPVLRKPGAPEHMKNIKYLHMICIPGSISEATTGIAHSCIQRKKTIKC